MINGATNSLALLCALIVAHCVCDYPLQGDFLSRAKNFRSGIPGVPWYQAMAAHTIIHAGAVWYLTGNAYVGLGELVAHFAIDYWKVQRTPPSTGNNNPVLEDAFDTDQFLHIICKLAWVLLVGLGLV